mgnify:CR=1 FL=1
MDTENWLLHLKRQLGTSLQQQCLKIECSLQSNLSGGVFFGDGKCTFVPLPFSDLWLKGHSVWPSLLAASTVSPRKQLFFLQPSSFVILCVCTIALLPSPPPSFSLVFM